MSLEYVLEAKEVERIAWEKAKGLNTHEAYKNFITDFPNSIYKEVATFNKNKLLADTAPDGMVFVQGGSFQMGSNARESNGKPVHPVTVPDFYIAKYEVTQKQWRAIMGKDPVQLHNKGCNECPVEAVNWNEVQEFLTRINRQTGEKYRLPSEAEWEYAARGGQQSKGYQYAGSNTINEVAWYSENYKNGTPFGEGKTTHPVGLKQVNELGLYDMSGNVWEWCEDDWHDDYNNAPKNGRAWVDNPRDSNRVIRGGSWSYSTNHCHLAFHGNSVVGNRSPNLGFRLASSL